MLLLVAENMQKLIYSYADFMLIFTILLFIFIIELHIYMYRGVFLDE